MKGVKDLILDDSPKNAKKLEKLLAQDPGSAAYLEAARAEAGSATAREFTKFRMMVTDSFVCFSRIGIAGALMIVPIAEITNIYRTSIIRNEYDFDQITLAVETANGIKYMANYPRAGAKTLDIFNEIIEAVRAKMTMNGGALS
jgi:hypothetical protein